MFEIEPSKKYRLIIIGDYNDADTIEKKTVLTGSEILRFLPLIEEIRKQSGHRMPDGSHHNFDVGELRYTPDYTNRIQNEGLISFYVEKGIEDQIIRDFIKICPFDYDGEYGIHTLWEVSVEEIVEIPTKKLFDIHEKFHYDCGRVVFH